MKIKKVLLFLTLFFAMIFIARVNLNVFWYFMIFIFSFVYFIVLQKVSYDDSKKDLDSVLKEFQEVLHKK